MINLSKRFLVIFLTIFFLSITSAYSLECCYNYGDSRISSSDSCSSDQISVGPVIGGSGCSLYEEKRSKCIIDTYTCSDAVEIGSKISRVYYIDGTIFPPEANDLCTDTEIFSTSSLSCSPSKPIQVDPTQDNANPDSGKTNDKNTGDLDTQGTAKSTTELEACSNAGLPFTYFVNKNSCEAISNCIYNPYQAGFLNSNYDNPTLLGLEGFENSCIHKSMINSCFAYKTKENCNNNKNLAKIDDTCKWIESKDYSEGIFSLKSGICVSKELSEDKYYNKESFHNRLNIVKNPSFELEDNSWIGPSPITTQKAYHGKKYISLETGESLSQILEKTSTKTYSISLYARTDSTGEIKITFAGTPLTSKTVNLENYEKIDFGTKAGSGNDETLLIEVLSGSVDIDAISVEVLESNTGNPRASSQIFKPVEIIPKDASNCNLCHDNLNLNLCTQTKSDLLGDCSYMVEDSSMEYKSTLSNYLGVFDNTYSDDNRKWESQSLENSLLFCEMYIDSDSCIDSNNYVNSKYGPYHNLADDRTLCQWNNDYGCFKDSNFDDKPDILSEDETIAQYVKDVDDSQKSDFELSCDSLPPNMYLYFNAINEAKETLTIHNSYETEKIGLVELNLHTSDVKLESCIVLGVENTLSFEALINGEKTPIIKTGKNQYFIKDNLANIFGVEIDSLLGDGPNTFQISVMDTSGNRVDSEQITLNIDLAPPVIELVSHDANEDNYLSIGPNVNLQFKVEDVGTSVESCSYTLEGDSTVKAEDFTDKGELIPNAQDSSLFDLPVPITKTADSGNTYLLKVSCEDIFGQEEVLEIWLNADYDTSLVIIEPAPFTSMNADIGFLNSQTDFEGISSDRELDSCRFEFDNLASSTILNSPVYNEQGFTNDNFNGVTFYNTITGSIDFTSDGVHMGKIICEDKNGNNKPEDITYYYDTQAPTITSYNLISNPAQPQNKIANKDGISYLTNDIKGTTAIHMELVVDGTVSWPKDYLDVYFTNEEVLIYEDPIEGSSVMRYKLSELDSTAKMNISIPIDFDNLYSGFETDENNLRKFSLRLDTIDKADNTGEDFIHFFIDNSTPSIEFKGDIISQREDKIYSKELDPNIIIDLSSPNYRDLSCIITYSSPTLSPTPIEKGSVDGEISFKLSEISSAIKLDDPTTHSLSVLCEDIYEISYEGTYRIMYDNTNPVLKDLRLVGGNQKIFRNYDSASYDDLIDSILFELEDTQEEGYTCTIKLEPLDESYICAEEEYDFSFTQFGNQIVNDFTFVNADSNSASESVCGRSQFLKDNLASKLESKQPHKTKIKVSGICEDLVGLKSQTNSLILNLDYYDLSFTDFDLEYSDSSAKPVIKSSGPFDNVKVFLGTPASLNPNLVLTISNYQIQDSEFVYRTTETIDTSNMNHGEYDIYVAGYDSLDNLVTTKTGKLLVDRQAPNVEINIPNMKDGKISVRTFNIEVSSDDEDSIQGDVENLEFFINNQLVYEKKGDEEGEILVDSYDLLKDETDKNNIIFTLKVPNFEDTYIFRAVAQDSHSNSGEDEVEAFINPIVDITLLDTPGESLVGSNPLLFVTRSDAPQIRFKLEGEDITCSISPLDDETSKDLIIEEIISYDLSSVLGFSLSDNSKVQIRLDCSNANNPKVPLYFEIIKIDSIPDYVLESELGLIVNEDPFTFNATIRSVGAFKPIKCEYRLDGSETILINEETKEEIDLNLDFTTLSDGTYSLELVCSDGFGYNGPTKIYQINRGELDELSISNFRIFNEREYDLNNYPVLVGERDLKFVFNTNRNDVSCDYSFNSGSLISNAISKVTSLFGFGRTNVFSQEPYTFSLDTAEVTDTDDMTLRVNCDDNLGNSAEVSYDIRYTEEDLSIQIE